MARKRRKRMPSSIWQQCIGQIPEALDLRHTQRCREDEDHLLTFYDFPPEIIATSAVPMRSRASQASSGNVTFQIDAFTTETSCLTKISAVMQDIRLPKIPVG